MKKILIIRLSAIGDIVLTTPIIRTLRENYPDARIDFVTKQKFKFAIENNPNIDMVHYWNNDMGGLIYDLKQREYDIVIDLHDNIRSAKIRKSLAKKNTFTLKKRGFEKWVLVKFKKDLYKGQHIVDRYFNTIAPLNLEVKSKHLEYFLTESDSIDLTTINLETNNYVAAVLGGTYATKRLPSSKHIEWISKSNKKVVLLGAKNEQLIAAEILAKTDNAKVIDLTGKLDFNKSAFVLKNASHVVTNDTGLMHVAAAFQKKIISVWGNTVPEFGMTPYLEDPTNNIILENKSIKCRPCSKLGYGKCPKKHFKCMKTLDMTEITKVLD